ncbi:MAG: hypothetical protein HZA46_15665 [Planctomycetales bacterium]|nr:hypothetical protein [Planctomycetales bacterium]
MSDASPQERQAPLDREEYVEQAYFFRVYRERLEAKSAAQSILSSIHEELLSTTKLPMAVQFLSGEILLNGRLADGMARLPHYFSPFQTFVMRMAEEDRSKFELKTALHVLEREAEYRTESPTPAGLFVYQFECLSRNRLGYDRGLEAMAADSMYDQTWREWALKIRRLLGAADFADLIFSRSEYYLNEQRRKRKNPGFQAKFPILFGAKEGRIAFANRGKDALYMFAALQRHLNYPQVPFSKPATGPERDIPMLQAKIEQLEKRIQLIESELKGSLDLSQFYTKPLSDEPME